MSSLSHESIFIAVKDALQRNGIKLWEPPFYLDSTSNESEMMILANRFCESLNIKFEYCLAAVNELQNHAIDKLQSNKELKEQGLATLKIRVPCKKSSGGTKLLSIKIKLDSLAENLMTMIESELHVENSSSIKLISSGRVLDPLKSLTDQNVKNFQQILAVETNEEESKIEDKSYNRIAKIRKDAEILLKKNGSDYFKLENQNGQAVHLPENERVSIMMALLLYEKGRAEMKKLNYADALILFLEADNEIQDCQNSPTLNTLVRSIDNIALLNLDITWCYLQLKSITQLPDAERRLMLCEENFKRSYGENFARLKVMKDGEMSERCLILRLKMLKGILYFHQNRREESLLFLGMAEQELSQLKVDDEKVKLMLEMGYNANESIIALRNTFNTTVEAAVNFIVDRRSKLLDARKIGRKERHIAKGLSSIGFDVNPRSICTLMEMGFNRELAALALQKTEGNLNESINLLQNNSDQLKAELADAIKPSQDLIEKLKTFGFNEDLVTDILKKNINNFDKALDILLEMQKSGQIPVNLLNSIEQSINSGASTSAANASSAEDSLNVKKRRTDNEISPEDEMSIFEDLRTGLDHLDEDDEYLNFGTLQTEQELILQYKRALGDQ